MKHSTHHPESTLEHPVPGSVSYAEQRLEAADGLMDTSESVDVIREMGEVVGLFKGGVMVETSRASGCSSCSSQKGCGISVLQDVFGRHHHQVTAHSDLPLRIGDQVQLVLPASALIEAALLMYLFPLIALVVGAVIGQTVFGANVFAILGGVMGFILSLLFIARLQSTTLRRGRFAPRVEQVLFHSAS
jgi:sigma-E factor negative regulatory protein RseC